MKNSIKLAQEIKLALIEYAIDAGKDIGFVKELVRLDDNLLLESFNKNLKVNEFLSEIMEVTSKGKIYTERCEAFVEETVERIVDAIDRCNTVYTKDREQFLRLYQHRHGPCYIKHLKQGVAKIRYERNCCDKILNPLEERKCKKFVDAVLRHWNNILEETIERVQRNKPSMLGSHNPLTKTLKARSEE